MTKDQRDVKCHGCGASFDKATLRVYQWHEEDEITDVAIGPTFVLDVSPRDGMEDDDRNWRRATVCHACFHAINPDLWVSRGMWESLHPLVPFRELPLPED